MIVRLVFGLQAHGSRVSMESCRGGAQAGRQLWRPFLDRGRKRRQNQGGGRRLKTPSRGGTGVGLGTGGGDGRRPRLGPRGGRRGDGRRAASRAVRRPRRERRLGRRRGGGNLPARGVLAVFTKPATSPGFADPSKPWIRSASTWRHRGEGFESKKETPPSDEIVYRFSAAPTGLTGLGAAGLYKSPPSPVRGG